MLYSTIHVNMYFIKKLPVMRMLSREREERRGGREENFLFSLPIFVVRGEKKTEKYKQIQKSALTLHEQSRRPANYKQIARQNSNLTSDRPMRWHFTRYYKIFLL